MAEGCAFVPTSDQVLVGSLFPAEKMMVAAARTSEQTTTLTALFEVTGRAQSAHVRADADKLARALVAMGTTDSFLLAWLHSHPGRGAQATVPSSIDRKQQEAWLQDYSPDRVGAVEQALVPKRAAVILLVEGLVASHETVSPSSLEKQSFHSSKAPELWSCTVC